ncbi:hypothetical protein [Segatella copri]|uniref:hypothetical protein n=1 Tax=Segatella copri TaxID=165179 RepID=UPI00193245DA|nr:hypothetical protein [Segatella copri]MBM0145106.1 hypothetical protein [Segatella copri]
MAKKASQFIFRKDYEKWLLKQGVKSVGAYCPQDKYKCNGKDYLYLDLIGVFAKENERLYVNALFEEWKAEIDKKNYLKTTLNRLSYLQKYRQFVETIVYGKKRLSKEDNEIFNEILNALPSVRDSINKSQNPKVDGMDSLIEFIKEEKFVKLAIESSYFFSPELVKKRVDEIANYICKEEEVDPAFDKNDINIKYLPARYSSKEKEDADDGVHEPVVEEGKVYFKLKNAAQRLCVIYQEGARGKNTKCGVNTCGGGNGNARVCQLINDRTGYALGATSDKKHFRNFIISHIWGHAIDPRYFTNLWNIVIVPAWANHLLDKDEEGTLASTFKATIQKIITELYDFNNIDWASIQMTSPSYNNEEVISGRYQINIIDHKSVDAPLGKIWKKPVSI